MLKYVKKTNYATQGPAMIPSIPDSKFIDELPKTVLEGQNVMGKEKVSHEAEIKLYHSLKGMKQNYLVIHQLKFTHEQYSDFVGEHLCDKENCEKGSQDHPCHQQPNDIEGECDIIVVGENFAAILEVKSLKLQHSEEDDLKLKGCCERTFSQRKRMRNLIRSIEPLVMVFEFTAFPNISIDEVGEEILKDETLLFSEDLAIVTSIFNHEERLSLPTVRSSAMDKLSCSLLGLWCINKEGKWSLDEFSLTSCIQDIDQKLRKDFFYK